MVHFVKTILYGDIGVGKTPFLASGVNDERCSPGLLLNLEAGLLSIESKVNMISIKDVKLGNASGVKGKIDVVRIENAGELETVLNALYTLSDKGKLPWKILSVDSLTEGNRLITMQATKENFENTHKGDGEVPQLQDYGRANVRMNNLIRDFRDLPIHIFFTALAVLIKDEMTGGTQIKPSFTGKLADEIPAMVDIMGYISVGKGGEREYRFQPSNRISAKDRSEGNKLGTSQTNLTLPKMFDLLGIGNKSTPTQAESLPIEEDTENLSDALPDPIHEPTGRKAQK